jgi:hypothetical protein
VSKIPDNISDLKAYFASKIPERVVSIRGFVGPKRDDGYHLGKSDIYGPGGQGDEDYSIQHPRDKAGLTDFSAAFDLTIQKRNAAGRLTVDRPAMAALTAYMEQETRAGRMDIAEFGGPGPDGRAYWHWIGRRGNWRKAILPEGNGHEDHVHCGIRRDRVPDDDLIADFEPLYGPRTLPLPPDDPTDPEPPPEPTDPEDRIAELEAALATMQTQMDAEKIAHGETRQQLVTAETKLAAAKNAAQSIVAL